MVINKMKTIFALILTLSYTVAFDSSDVVSARIESCRGCSLNRLPEVKKCIMNDVPEYDRVDVKFITGAPPELVLLGAGDHELERLPLSQLNRQQCNQLLVDHGFNKNHKPEL